MDFRQLFKLRLLVAALGETQRVGWWNSGVLTGTGEFLFQQGFPRSSPFAQTRAGFRVAQLACDEAATIGLMLPAEVSAKKLYLELRDAATDLVLHRSPDLPVDLLG